MKVFTYLIHDGFHNEDYECVIVCLNRRRAKKLIKIRMNSLLVSKEIKTEDIKEINTDRESISYIV